MRKTQSPARLVLSGRALLGGALLVVALVVAACGGSAPGPTQPAATLAPGNEGTAVAPANTVQATPGTGPSAPSSTAEPGSQEAGVSANFNPAAKFTTHYKGDPNAKVVLIEISDFQ